MHTSPLPRDPADYAEPVTEYEYDVPAEESPATRCPYCDRPFRNEQFAAFHVGTEHTDACTEAELERYETERDEEEHDLFTFHLKAAASVFLLYFLFTFFYALAWVGRF